MKAAPFTYHRPKTAAALVAALGELNNAKILAGGQSLVAMLNLRYLQPDHVIDIVDVPGLRGIDVNGDALVIGAMERQATLAKAPAVREAAPLVIEALTMVGHAPTRSRGTIGGSLCHLDPAAELPAAALAHEAVMNVAGGAQPRRIAIEDWFADYMSPSLAPGEYLETIELRAWPAGHGYGFQEFSRRRGDFAVAGAASLVLLDEAMRVRTTRAVVFGLGTRPVRLPVAENELIGQVPDDALIERACAALDDVQVLQDAYGGVEYRRRVAREMLRGALQAACQRAGRR